MATLTVPTVITKEEYQNAVFVKDPNNGDEYIVWNNGRNTLWVGNDSSSASYKDWNPINPLNGTYIDSVDVIDENGNRKEIETAWVSPMSNMNNDLCLESLAQGKIEWR